MMGSLPGRPLAFEEVEGLDESGAFEQAVPVTVFFEGGEMYVASVVLLTESEAVAVVFNEGWQVLQREERPSPPAEFEEAIVSYMDEHFAGHQNLEI